MRALMGRIEPRSPSRVRARTRTERNLQPWSSKLKRACQISHGAGAVSLVVIPVSRDLRDAVCVQGWAVGVALESIKRGGLGAHIEGETTNLNRLGEEDIDRVGEADAPSSIDSRGISLDLRGRAGLHLGGAGHRWHDRSFRYLHYSP